MTTPEKQGIDSGQLVDMMEHIKMMEAHFDSILIVRNGYLVTDAYFFPFEKGLKHIIHSSTKSITSALVGIAIDKGYIKSIDQPVIDFFPDKSFKNVDGNKRAMTLKHLLMMASGVDCRDSWKYNWAGLEQMKRSDDWVQFFLDLPMSEAPGEKYEYCNGASFILGAIIQKVTEMKLRDFADKYLFKPLGITEISWQESPQGINIGWGTIWLKPHDMAKFGFLFLNKGQWNDKQIVSESWVDLSTQGHIHEDIFDKYGFQWRLDSDGYYMALGYGGQYIFVIPNKNMVVVFTGIHVGYETLRANSLLKLYIIRAATSSGALPENLEKNRELSAMINEMARTNLAKPVPPLPEFALKISGKTFNFEENVLGLKSLTFNFTEPSDVMHIDWLGNKGSVLKKLIVGLDDVYRLQGYDKERWARKGAWTGQDTFTVYYHNVGNTNKGVATMKFQSDKVSAEFRDKDNVNSVSLHGVYSEK